MPYGILAADQIQSSVTGSSIGPGNATRFKNRLINGDMRIDQRNAGASVTLTSSQAYTIDRWSAAEDTDGTMTAQQSTVAPTGFTNSVVFTTGTADASLSASQFASTRQLIEGLNVADLGWGTANAKTITVSFWVRSSLAGTFGGSLRNSANNRSYPFSYTITAANTWEYETITIAGDTSGTWLTTNGIGINLTFSLGAGSNFEGTAGAWNSNNNITVAGATSVVGTAGATFYITGVQLEVGSSATGFEYVDYGTQLQMCQRYYEMSYPLGSVAGSTGNPTSTTSMTGILTTSYILSYVSYKVPKRASPTITVYDLAGNINKCTRGNVAVGAADNSAVATQNISANGFQLYSTGTYNATNLDFNYTSSAEL